jgi:hypothetical protein
MSKPKPIPSDSRLLSSTWPPNVALTTPMMTRSKKKLHGSQATYIEVPLSYSYPAYRSSRSPPQTSPVDLNEQRQLGRELLNARLSAYNILPRQLRSIPRPRGEAGRKGTIGHRDGFTLKDILKDESNVSAEHYGMIQVWCAVPFLPELMHPAGHRASTGRKVP